MGSSCCGLPRVRVRRATAVDHRRSPPQPLAPQQPQLPLQHVQLNLNRARPAPAARLTTTRSSSSSGPPPLSSHHISTHRFSFFPPLAAPATTSSHSSSSSQSSYSDDEMLELPPSLTGGRPASPWRINTVHHHHHHHDTAAANNKPFVLVPLYIYPTATSWAPLYEAAAAHPDLEFAVVVNPANGPGDGMLPDANYVEAAVRLTQLANVRLIGYVHVSYGARGLEAVVADVERYGRWEGEMAGLGEEGKSIIVDGIFVDETPSSTEFVQYMATLANTIKTVLNRNVIVPVTPTTTDPAVATPEPPTAAADDDEKQLEETIIVTTPDDKVSDDKVSEESSSTLSKQPSVETAAPTPTGALTPPPAAAAAPATSTALVIYNPGVVIDPIFYEAADYIVAFENAAAAWPSVRQSFARLLPPPLRARSIAVAHSAAAAEGQESLGRRLVEGCGGGGGVFVTSCAGYTEWCPRWREFVAEVARAAAAAAERLGEVDS